MYLDSIASSDPKNRLPRLMMVGNNNELLNVKSGLYGGSIRCFDRSNIELFRPMWARVVMVNDDFTLLAGFPYFLKDF